jgi:DNA primase
MHWNALAAGLTSDPERGLAIGLMSEPLLSVDSGQESKHELRELLNRMLIDNIKALETQAIEDAKADPDALIRYRELQNKRLLLEKSQTGAII